MKLYLHFLRFSFSKAMEFRVDFFFRIFMDLLFYAVNIAFFKILFLHTNLLAGWNESQAMVFVAGFLFVDALNMTIFSNNLWWIPTLVNKGDLDYYLVRPVSSLFFLTLREFAANSFLNLLMTVGILYWAITSYTGVFTYWQVFAFILFLLVGTVTWAFLHLIFILPVFWTHSGRGLSNIFYSIGRVSEKPDRIFNGWARKIFTTVLPFSVINSFPARLIVEEFSWSVVFHIISVTTAVCIILALLWRYSLRSYSSASS